MTAFCEPDDVQQALQEADESFTTAPLGDANVTAAIEGVSSWFERKARGYWYDSTADPSDLISSSPATVSGVTLDVPSSPHRQAGQLFRTGHATHTTPKYPLTRAGPYVKVTLPRSYVQSVDTLEVRARDGSVDDWVTEPDKTEGQGDDYYIQIDRETPYGKSYLYIDAGSIGPRKDFEHLLRVDLSYGLDADTEAWTDVRRGVAALAAAQVVINDDVLSMIPDDGQLIGVDTQADQLLRQALGRDGGMGEGYLVPYLQH